MTNSAGQSVTVYKKETVFRNNAWDVDVKVDGRIDWADGQLTEDLVNAQIELAEDCDMDCQKRGSAMTVVAILMRTAYGIIALNALFMFIGAWRYRARVCSIYCTFVSCLCQFILQIVAATMMFTKYNNVCMRSMTNTFTLHRRCSRALALSPGLIFGVIISWAHMPAALCSVRAFQWVVEMFLACALEEATTNMEGDRAVSFGQIYSTALNKSGSDFFVS